MQQGAIWAACRVDNRTARNICFRGIGSADRETTLAGLHAVALWRDRGAFGPLIKAMSSKDLAIRRAAAEAFGRIGDPLAIPIILPHLSDRKSDRVFDHSLTYALIEIGDPDATAKALKGSPPVRRACLTALETDAQGPS